MSADGFSSRGTTPTQTARRSCKREVWGSVRSKKTCHSHSNCSSSCRNILVSSREDDVVARGVTASSPGGGGEGGGSSGGEYQSSSGMDSVPVERTSSFQRDAHTESTKAGFEYIDFSEEELQEPSATQTEKSTFLWVPLIENDNAPSSTAATSQNAKPAPAYGKTESCLWRDPYLLALDAAVGRSFTERIPPLKAMKTERDSERYKHGIPRPPPSYRYPMRSALKPALRTPPRATAGAATAPATELDDLQQNFHFRQGLRSATESKEKEEEAIKAFEVQASERQRCSNWPVQQPPCNFLDSQPAMPNPFAHAEPPKRRAFSCTPTDSFRFSASGIRRTFTKFQSRGAEQKPTTAVASKTPSPTRSCAPGGTYDLFRTRWRRISGRPLDRQFNKTYPKRLADYMIDEEKGRCEDFDEVDECGLQPALSAARYVDALEGPELEIPKDCENLLLPPDEKWPFLLRFPVGCFGITVALAGQALLWKSLATSPQLTFLHIPSCVNLYLWCLCALSLALVSFIYLLKFVFFSEAVRREFYHPVRVNFFFTPWIAAMLLALGLPSIITKSMHPAVWCVFMAPIVLLELKLYGEWISGGDRHLSRVANPCTHLSVVGNFVGSILATTVGWREPAIFFWAVGVAQYLVLFATLHQSSMPSSSTTTIKRNNSIIIETTTTTPSLPGNETRRRTPLLPKDQLHPVSFLFIVAPSAASIAWMQIIGNFDIVSRLCFFVALFLYSSLIFRIKFSRHLKFSITWWAYTFPMTMVSIAAILYCHEEAQSWIAKGLAIGLSFVSSAVVFMLCCLTLLQAFVCQSLFPNDLAIAITVQRPNCKHKGSPTNEDDNNNGCGGLYSLHH